LHRHSFFSHYFYFLLTVKYSDHFAQTGNGFRCGLNAMVGFLIHAIDFFCDLRHVGGQNRLFARETEVCAGVEISLVRNAGGSDL
jgi:hypothetical protein